MGLEILSADEAMVQWRPHGLTQPLVILLLLLEVIEMLESVRDRIVIDKLCLKNILTLQCNFFGNRRMLENYGVWISEYINDEEMFIIIV